jgi:hypothetical protein
METWIEERDYVKRIVAKNIKGMADYSEPFVCFFKFTFWA